jgi:hypothetical protein
MKMEESSFSNTVRAKLDLIKLIMYLLTISSQKKWKTHLLITPFGADALLDLGVVAN